MRKYRGLFLLSIVFIGITFLLTGCTRIVAINNLQNQDKFVARMREIDPRYKIRARTIDPRTTEFYVNIGTTDSNNIGVVFTETVHYILSEETYALYKEYLDNKQLFPQLLEYIHIYIYMDKKFTNNTAFDHISAFSWIKDDKYIVEAKQARTSYPIWTFIVQDENNISVVEKRIFFFDGANWIDEETGEAPDWEDIFAELEP